MAKVLVVLTLDVPDPQDVARALLAIDPPRVPGFAGIARVVIEPEASIMEDWLDK